MPPLEVCFRLIVNVNSALAFKRASFVKSASLGERVFVLLYLKSPLFSFQSGAVYVC